MYSLLVASAASSSSSATASSCGMPTMPYELPDTAYKAFRPVTGCLRTTGCVMSGIFAFCSSVSGEVRFWWTEAPRERDILRGVERLAMQHEHLRTKEHALELGEFVVRKRS